MHRGASSDVQQRCSGVEAHSDFELRSVLQRPWHDGEQLWDVPSHCHVCDSGWE